LLSKVETNIILTLVAHRTGWYDPEIDLAMHCFFLKKMKNKRIYKKIYQMKVTRRRTLGLPRPSWHCGPSRSSSTRRKIWVGVAGSDGFFFFENSLITVAKM
jgi:hypothetical protein